YRLEVRSAREDIHAGRGDRLRNGIAGGSRDLGRGWNALARCSTGLASTAKPGAHRVAAAELHVPGQRGGSDFPRLDAVLGCAQVQPVRGRAAGVADLLLAALPPAPG